MTRRARWCGHLRWLGAFVVPMLLACDGVLTDPAPYGTVRVVARTRDGAALPGIGAELYTGPRPIGYGTTDTAGSIAWMLVPEGRYGVLLTLPDSYTTIGALSGAPGGDQVDDVPVAATSDTTLTFTLLRKGPGRVESQVVDEAGVPLAGMPVGLFSPRGIIAERRTDATGHATFADVPYGNYGVFTVPPDSFGVPNAAWIVRDGLLVDRGYAATATLRMPRCTGRLVVTVRDQLNQPLPGFAVRRFTATRVWPAVATGADGIATISQVICGEYGVYVEAQAGFTVPWARDTAYVDGLAVTSGATRTAALRALRLP